MVKTGLKDKLKKWFIIFLGCLLLAVISIVMLKDNSGTRSYKSVIAENKLLMNGLEMVYLFDNTSYINLYSKKAYADKLSSAVELSDIELKYNGDNMVVNAEADNGQYELEKLLTAYGNVKGSMNDFDFVTGENGNLTYDYKEGEGKVENGITLNQGRNYIQADKAEFNVNNNFVLFKDNVVVEYFTAEPIPES